MSRRVKTNKGSTKSGVTIAPPVSAGLTMESGITSCFGTSVFVKDVAGARHPTDRSSLSGPPDSPAEKGRDVSKHEITQTFLLVALSS
jgi:hypothetical protein